VPSPLSFILQSFNRIFFLFYFFLLLQVMDALLKAGADPSLSNKDGDPLDAKTIVATYQAMGRRAGIPAISAPKDEL
jgi:hypothetical protein